jgi:hypothetical protein
MGGAISKLGKAAGSGRPMQIGILVELQPQNLAHNSLGKKNEKTKVIISHQEIKTKKMTNTRNRTSI